MFVREKKFKNRKKSYLQIVENQRVSGRVQQKVVLSLGSLQSLLESGELKRLARSLLKYCENEFYDTNDIKEEARLHWGGPKVIEQLWKMFDFETILKKCAKDRCVQFDIARTVKLMLIDRLLSPCSKLKSYEQQESYPYCDSVELHHLYRALDYLDDFKEQIEKELFFQNLNLFNMRIDVVFYDVTTFYFESQKADQLRNFGYGKDKKYDEVQVVMGLLVDLDGRPIGYDIFAGNLYEGHTLKNAVEKLQKRFALEKIILVADRGMMSAANLEYLRNSEYEYIISARLKKLPKAIRKEVLDIDSYLPIPGSSFQGDEESPSKYKIYVPKNVFGNVISALMLKKPAREVYKEIRKITNDVHNGQLVKKLREFYALPYTNENIDKLLKEIEHYCSQRLILTWSEKRARRDKAKRDLLIDKAEKLLKMPTESLSQRGARRYIKSTSDCFALNHDKIDKDQRWDGFYGIYTNNKDLDWRAIQEQYRCLWRIEESFRIFKSHLETRPMFHWTPSRIRGHMMLCFIAFLFQRTIEIKLKGRQIEFSTDKIREALDQMQMSLLDIKGKPFYMRANIGSLAKEILKIFQIRTPPHIQSVDNFEV